MKALIKRIPALGWVATRLWRRYVEPAAPFAGSTDYWVRRYQSGGDSGAGSHERLAAMKAEVLNDFVAEQHIESVIEYGCGDGSQLKRAKYESYTGFDVSQAAIARCQEIFRGAARKRFKLVEDYAGETAQLTLSLDVVYHLVEDVVFEQYMHRLFDSATAYVIVYASNTDQQAASQMAHVRHRKFTDWVERSAPGWRLRRHIPNPHPFRGDVSTGSFADFYIFEKAL